MHMRGERVKILYLRTYYVNDPLVVLIATYFPVGHRSIYIINLQIDSNLCINATLASTCKKVNRRIQIPVKHRRVFCENS